MPHGQALEPPTKPGIPIRKFQCPHGLELLQLRHEKVWIPQKFQCPHGLELLRNERATLVTCRLVSMPSWA